MYRVAYGSCVSELHSDTNGYIFLTAIFLMCVRVCVCAVSKKRRRVRHSDNKL
jgi:hypothetical protein